MYGVRDHLAVPKLLLNAPDDTWFLPKAVIILGGLPRRVYKMNGSIDGANVKPFVVPKYRLECEKIIEGLALTAFDEVHNAEPSADDKSDAYGRLAQYHAEVQERLKSGGTTAGESLAMHIFAWGCITACSIDSDGRIRTVKALREVSFQGSEESLTALAMLTSQIDIAHQSGGYVELQIDARGSIWSPVKAGASDDAVAAVSDVRGLAARENARAMVKSLKFYILNSTARQFDWGIQLEDGDQRSADSMREIMTTTLGPEMVIQDIPGLGGHVETEP